VAKLTHAQADMLRNIRDHGDPYRGIHGMSASGGASQTIASLVRRELIDAGAELTIAGRELIDKVSPAPLSSQVRQVLRDAGLAEYPRREYGFKVRMSVVEGSTARVSYKPRPDVSRIESTLKYGNHEISSYVRALQAKGFRAYRVKGVGSFDTLLVMPSS
jgi:hypothetical protein